MNHLEKTKAAPHYYHFVNYEEPREKRVSRQVDRYLSKKRANNFAINE